MRRPTDLHRMPLPLALFLAGFLIWLYAPIAVVVAFSFNSLKSLQTFGSPSLRWYREFLGNDALTSSFLSSLKIAFVVMLLALLLGLLVSFGISRSHARYRKFSVFLLLVPLATPEIVSGVALLLFYRQLSMTLSVITIIVAHTTFFIAYVNMILQARLSTFGSSVEEAARDLGASSFQAWRLVTLPLMRPALLSAGLLVFALSFDNFILSFFTSGVSSQTLPVRIWASIRFGITPTINAAGSLMILVSLVVTVIALIAARRVLVRPSPTRTDATDE